MILYLIGKIPYLRTNYFNNKGRKYVLKKLEHILPHLIPKSKVLDIGSGNGLITSVLRNKHYDVTPLDIHEGHYHPSVKPVLYDGKKMPFADDTFDTGLLLTILHHTSNQEEILTEAKRVCRQIIIMEDIYETDLQKQYVFLIDSLVNLFYSECPHTNRTDAGWKELFAQLGLKLTASYYKKFMGVMQVVYVLEEMKDER